jgi:hypothetical protein
MTKEFFDRGKWIAKWADNNMTKDEYPSKQEILKTISDAVYAQYPKKEWQGLSDDEILEIDKSIDPKIIIGKGKTLFARAIEQALKEKNT